MRVEGKDSLLSIMQMPGGPSRSATPRDRQAGTPTGALSAACSPFGPRRPAPRSMAPASAESGQRPHSAEFDRFRLPIASVPTGMPAGICMMDRRLSCPRAHAWIDRQPPSTRQCVGAAVIPRQMRGPAGARDDELKPLPSRALANCIAGPGCGGDTISASVANPERASRISRAVAWSPSRLASMMIRPASRHWPPILAANTYDYRMLLTVTEFCL